MRIRHWTHWGVLGLVGLCGATAEAAGLIPNSAPPDVALVFTGDVIGFLDPCG